MELLLSTYRLVFALYETLAHVQAFLSVKGEKSHFDLLPGLCNRSI